MIKKNKKEQNFLEAELHYLTKNLEKRLKEKKAEIKKAEAQIEQVEELKNFIINSVKNN